MFQNKTYFIVGAKAKLGSEPREAAARVFPDAAAAIWRRWRRYGCRLALDSSLPCRQVAASF